MVVRIIFFSLQPSKFKHVSMEELQNSVFCMVRATKADIKMSINKGTCLGDSGGRLGDRQRNNLEVLRIKDRILLPSPPICMYRQQ